MQSRLSLGAIAGLSILTAPMTIFLPTILFAQSTTPPKVESATPEIDNSQISSDKPQDTPSTEAPQTQGSEGDEAKGDEGGPDTDQEPESSLKTDPKKEIKETPDSTNSKELKAGFAVQTNSPPGSVLSGGVLLGKTGQRLEITAGIQQLVIDVAGYTKRPIWVQLSPGENRSILVNLRKVDPKLKLPLFASRYGDGLNQKIKSRDSICKQFPPVPPKPMYACKRKSWQDDIEFADIGIKLNPSTQGLTNTQKKFYTQILKDFRDNPTLTGRWRIKAERLFAEAPEHAPGYDLVSHAALLGGDCERILMISDSAAALKVNSARTLTARAICLEGEANYHETYRDAAYAVKIQTAQPDSYFHLARLAIAEQRVDYIARILDTCSIKFPLYFPCYQLNALYSDANKNKKKVEMVTNAMISSVISDAPTAVHLLFDFINRGENDAVLPLAQEAVKKKPDRFELQWILLLYAMEAKKDEAVKRLAARLEVTRVGDSRIATKLIEFGEKHNYPDAMENAYRVMIRWLPQDPYYYWQLAKLFHAQEGRCPEVHRIMKEAPLTPSRASFALLTINAQCFLSENDFGEAIRNFERATIHAPKEWRGFFNLAIAQDRAGSKTDAIKNFETALSLSPPTDTQTKIQATLKALEPFRK